MKRFYTTIFTSLITLCIYSQTTHTVNAGNFYYSPSSLTIDVGDSVAWINDGGFHDVNGDIETTTGQPYNNPETFDSPSTNNSFIFGYRFSIPGTYNYDCSVGSHAANGMVGTIIVQSPPVTPSLNFTAVMDVDLSGSSGKALMFTANQTISDLSDYGFGTANNGGGSDGEEFTFSSISISAGQHVIVCRDSASLSTYFDGCLEQFPGALYPTIIIQSPEPTGNGNDAYELFFNGNTIETFGDVTFSGGSSNYNFPWVYRDSWAWKDTAIANVGNWVYGGDNCSDGSVTTQTSSCPFPLCSTGSTTNVLNGALSSKITVYPNPSDEIINISCNELIKSVSVYNLLGKKVYEKSMLNIRAQININEFNRDIYLLKVSTESGDNIFHKIIKN
jgi:plastocyanin